MDYHKGITLEHPIIWAKDKIHTGLNRMDLFIIGFIPVAFSGLAVVSDTMSVFGLGKTAPLDQVVKTLLWMFFAFACLNLLFVILLQRNGVRLQREKENYSTLHKEVIERVREYYSAKRQAHPPLKRSSIRKHLEDILRAFNDNYMRKIHRNKVSACIKYTDKRKIYPIRVGGDIADRNPKAEKLSDSYVYKSLNMPGKKKRYIYVKDIRKPDLWEKEALGANLDEIRLRAKGKYNSFIAMPIRAGKMISLSEDFTTRPDLGMVGFDLKEPFGFGSFEEHEMHYIACFTDIISELILDIVNSPE